MTAEPHTAAVALVIFLAAVTRSAFGFGAALVAMPLLSLFLPLEVVSPLMALLSPLMAATIVARDWRQVHLGGLWRLTAAAVFGVPLGVLLLKGVAEGPAKALLGAIIIAFSAFCLLSPRRMLLTSDQAAWGFGFAAGVLGGAYNVHGPPLVVFGTLRDWDAARFRATIQGYLLPMSLYVVAAHALAGLWSRAVLWYFLVSLPVLVVSVPIGSWLTRLVGGRHFHRYVHALLIVLGAALLARSLRG